MTVITGGRGDACEAQGFVASSRAGDRLERYAAPALASFFERADAAALDRELAVRLCVEAALVRNELRELGVDRGVLDRTAERARITQRLDDRDAAYARRLTQVTDQPAAARALATVGLPLRLTAQLADVDLADLLRDADPDQARAWELAALAEGRTMSEWAFLAALRAQNFRLRA